MFSLKHPLERFIGPNGPILKIESKPYQIFFENTKKVWFSIASIHPSIQRKEGMGNILTFSGGSWDYSKRKSQNKSLTEAVERWASTYYQYSNPNYSGLHIDSTSNGFAAVPSSKNDAFVQQHSFLEAVERWGLEKFWTGKLAQVQRQNKFLSIKLNFRTKGILEVVSSKIYSKESFFKNHATLIIAFYWIKDKGVLVGSSCGFNIKSAIDHAIFELTNHLRGWERFEETTAPPKGIIEKRLFNFASKKKLSGQVKKSIQLGISNKNPNFFPEIIFNKKIEGPWEPEIKVHRVLVDDCHPITDGGEERFLI